MAISILTRVPQNFGSQSGALGTVQLDTSYPTGGYSLPASMFQLDTVNGFFITTDDASLLFYNYVTQKLMAFTAAGGVGGNTGATSGGTPAGTNASSPITGNANAQIFTGAALGNHNHSVPFTDNGGVPVGVPVFYDPATSSFNVDIGTGGPVGTTATSAGTPAGTNAASTLMASADPQVFTGTPLAPHTHTVAGGAGGLSEVANGTNLSAVIGNYIIIGS